MLSPETLDKAWDELREYKPLIVIPAQAGIHTCLLPNNIVAETQNRMKPHILRKKFAYTPVKTYFSCKLNAVEAISLCHSRVPLVIPAKAGIHPLRP
jgi:hypothetical protein